MIAVYCSEPQETDLFLVLLPWKSSIWRQHNLNLLPSLPNSSSLPTSAVLVCLFLLLFFFFPLTLYANIYNSDSWESLPAMAWFFAGDAESFCFVQEPGRVVMQTCLGCQKDKICNGNLHALSPLVEENEWWSNSQPQKVPPLATCWLCKWYLLDEMIYVISVPWSRITNRFWHFP